MNAQHRPGLDCETPLAGLAFAALAPGGQEDGVESVEAAWLNSWVARLESPASAWQSWRHAPPAADLRLHGLALELRLAPVEVLAVALAAAVELDAMAGRVLAWLQSPTGGPRPTAGLAAAAACALEGHEPSMQLAALAGGQAVASGVLRYESDARPLPETALRMPLQLALALAGLSVDWPDVETGLVDPPALPPSLQTQAARYAQTCRRLHQPLVIRSGHPLEARVAAQMLANALGAQPAFLRESPPPGIGAWLWLTGRVPVLCMELAPGELRTLPSLPGYSGPVLVASGYDGAFQSGGEPVAAWRLSAPQPEERVSLWRQAGGDTALAAIIGRDCRHGAARIHGLARAGRFQASLAGQAQFTTADIASACRSGVAADLGSVAELQPDAVGEDALVLPPSLRNELDALASRCIARDSLVTALGPATRTRHRVGVRALLHGPSGTGKTLAAGWLATRLGLPLYRVDLASVTSKYIGETEKNLAQLFARAEHAEVVLLFDEADSLFGKRTDVKDSNDRFANAQTNYLLQRIESFEGIVVLTSNSRARFDSAFVRRLDMIIEFPHPAPDERRALWLAHLGEGHALAAAELNRLAGSCDLAGGHIRNAVLAAAVIARQDKRMIEYSDLVAGAAAEYRKLGKQLPSGLGAGLVR